MAEDVQIFKDRLARPEVEWIADAIGGENVYAVAMPSRYSSDHSLTDAEALAENLKINYQVVPIEKMHAAFEQGRAGLRQRRQHRPLGRGGGAEQRRGRIRRD